MHADIPAASGVHVWARAAPHSSAVTTSTRAAMAQRASGVMRGVGDGGTGQRLPGRTRPSSSGVTVDQIRVGEMRPERAGSGRAAREASL